MFRAPCTKALIMQVRNAQQDESIFAIDSLEICYGIKAFDELDSNRNRILAFCRCFFSVITYTSSRRLLCAFYPYFN